jgi:hypothetical protein
LNCFHLGERAFHSRSLSPTQHGCAALQKRTRGGAPHQQSNPTSEITPSRTSAFHSRTRPRPANPSGASRANTHLSFFHVLTRAQRKRVHFCPKHRLGFCAICVCISSSSSSGSRRASIRRARVSRGRRRCE